MGAFESEWLRHSEPRPRGEATFRRLAAAAIVLFLGSLAAMLAGAPRETSSLIFTTVVLPLPFVAWWAHARAPDELRPIVRLCAWAATLWIAGSLVSYAFFLANNGETWSSPGAFELFFVAAQLLVIAAIVVAGRSLVSVRLLDACVIVVAGFALGAAFMGRSLERGTSFAAIATLNRPILGVITLTLIAAAALASPDGLPRSIVLLGTGEVALTAGNLLYSHAVHNDHVDDRWASLAWAAGAGLCMLAAAAIILEVDRPLRAATRAGRFPGHPPRTGNVLLVDLLAAAAAALAVAFYGLLTDHRTVGLVGASCAAAITTAMALRGRDAIATAERSSAELDRALARSEQTCDALRSANADLQQRNLELRMLRIVAAQWLAVLDERTDGRLRALVEEAGDVLESLIDEQTDP